MKILPEPVRRKSGRALQSCTDFRNGQALNRDSGKKKPGTAVSISFTVEKASRVGK